MKPIIKLTTLVVNSTVWFYLFSDYEKPGYFWQYLSKNYTNKQRIGFNLLYQKQNIVIIILIFAFRTKNNYLSRLIRRLFVQCDVQICRIPNLNLRRQKLLKIGLNIVRFLSVTNLAWGRGAEHKMNRVNVKIIGIKKL